jgi:hypothetical protein
MPDRSAAAFAAVVFMGVAVYQCKVEFFYRALDLPQEA